MHGDDPGARAGRERREALHPPQFAADEDVVVLPEVSHLALLNHPEVYAVLRARLAVPPRT